MMTTARTPQQQQIDQFISHLNILQDLGYSVPTQDQIKGLIATDMGMDYIVKTNAYMNALHDTDGKGGYRAEMKKQLDTAYATQKPNDRQLVQARMNAFRIQREANNDRHHYEVTAKKQAAAAQEIRAVDSTFQKSITGYHTRCFNNMPTLIAGYYDEDNINLYDLTEKSYKEMLKNGAEIERNRKKKLKIKIHGLDEHWNPLKGLNYHAAYNQSVKQTGEATHTVATVYDIKTKEENNSVTYTFGGPAWVFHLWATPKERLQFFVLLYEDIVDRHYQRPIFTPNPNEKLKYRLATAIDFLKAQRHAHQKAMEKSGNKKSDLPFVELDPESIEEIKKEIAEKAKNKPSWFPWEKDPSDLSPDEAKKLLDEIEKLQGEIRFLTDRSDTLEERKAEDQKQEKKVELQKADREYNQTLEDLKLDDPDKQVHRIEKLYEPIEGKTEPESDASLMLEIIRQKALTVEERNNPENTEKKRKLIDETEEKYAALSKQAQQAPGDAEANQKTITELANDLYVNIQNMYTTQASITKKDEQIREAQDAENAARNALTKVETELRAVTQTIDELSAEQLRLNDENAQLNVANQGLGERAAEIQENITRLEGELTQQQNQSRALEEEVVKEGQQLETLERELEQTQEQINVLDEQIIRNEQIIQDLGNQIKDLPVPTGGDNGEEKQSNPEVDQRRENLQQQMTQEQQNLGAQTNKRQNHTVKHDLLQEKIDVQRFIVTDQKRSLAEINQRCLVIQKDLNNQTEEAQRIQTLLGQNQQMIITNEERLRAIPDELNIQETEVKNKKIAKTNQEKKLKEKTSIFRAEETEHAVLNRELSELQKGIEKIKNQLLTIDPQKRAERLVWFRWLSKDGGIDKMLETTGDILTAVPAEFQTEYRAKLGYNRLVKHYAEKAKTVKESFDKLLSKNNKDQFEERLYNLYRGLALGNISPEQYHADIQAFQKEFDQYKSELNKMNETVQAMIVFCNGIPKDVLEDSGTPENKALVQDYNSLRRTLFSMTGEQTLLEDGEGLTGPSETLQDYMRRCNEGLPYQKEQGKLQERVHEMRYKNKARDIVPYSLDSLRRPFKEEDGSSAAVKDAMALEEDLCLGDVNKCIQNVSSNCNRVFDLRNQNINTAVDSLNALKKEIEKNNQNPISLYSGVSSSEPREGLGLQLERIEKTLEACYSNAQKFREELKALDQARLALELRYTDHHGTPINRDAEYDRQVALLQQHALRIQLQLVEISAVAEVARDRYKRLTPQNCRFPYWGSAASQKGTGGKVFDSDVLSEKVREKLHLSPSSSPSTVYGQNADDEPEELKYHEIYAPRINRLFYYLNGGDTYTREPVKDRSEVLPVLVNTGDDYVADTMFADHGQYATAAANRDDVKTAARAADVGNTNFYRYQ